MKKHEIVLAAFEEQRGTFKLLFKSSTLKETQKEVRELATKEKTHKLASILFRLGVHSLTSRVS